MMDIEVTSDLVLPNGQPLGVVNHSGIALGDIARDPQVRQLASQIGEWVEKARRGPGPAGMMNRTNYLAPTTPYDLMRAARAAVREDDVISGLADATEAIAFDGGLKWEASDPDDADIFNQMSADLNLDAKIREMWREIFTVDQFVAAKIWDYKTYSVRGTTTKGNKRKTKYRVWVPTRLVLLRPEQVVPIGYGPLREDELAWHASANEIGNYDRIVNSTDSDLDPLMRAFFAGQYKPGLDEESELLNWGVTTDRLLKMRSDWVFRHTSTRPDWAKHPDLRLRGVFELLDLKRQLIASDRAMLVGAANYILLIRKGSKDQPATQDEVSNLKAGYQFLAKLPVIISDHRLEIDIVAPKLDFVLKRDAYETLDTRILTRVLGTFTSPRAGGRAGGGSQDTFADVLVAGIGSQRHMIKRALEQNIARAIVEHPKNAGIFEDRPSLVFTPRNVALGTNQAVLSAILALRTQREMSRDTVLEYLGLDQATEAQRLETEEERYDSIFKTAIPFSAAQPGQSAPAPDGQDDEEQNAPAEATPEPPAASGRRGGRPRGGGTTPNSPQAQTKPRSANGNIQPDQTKRGR